MDNSTVTAEFKNVDDVKKFKNHAVDVYGLSYSGYCLKNKYIYGELHWSDYLEKSRRIPINLWVNGEHQTISTDKVSTNKKLVTAQEIDTKLEDIYKKNIIFMALMIQIKEEIMVISQNLVLDLMQEKYYFI